MGLFDKNKEAVFIKESTSAITQLEELKALLPKADTIIKKQIEQEIRMIQYGIIGEKQIAFELRNSHMPMFILHDLYFTLDDYSAQIDYIIVTKKKIFIIECKNLYGNIEVNNSGDFIRTVSYNGYTKKEGIYSPITQNNRHLELIKLLRSRTKGFLTKALFENSFYDNYCGVVVLANPQTVLNAKYAKKDVKDKIIRADQLVRFIQTENAKIEFNTLTEQEAEDLANWFLSQSKDNPVNYLAKYQNIDALKEDKKTDAKSSILCPKCGAPMVIRKATKGSNIGKQFYGCSNYPKCHAIVKIQS